MKPESLRRKKERVSRIIHALGKAYPDAHCELNYSTPFELLIATILSAQCSDKQVNVVTKDLFQRYRTAADFANAPEEELANALRRLGLYRNKARNIKACCEALERDHHGQVPQTLD